jgi:penicillin amidase
MFEFLAPAGTEWDAPLIGDAVEEPRVPGPDVFDLRKRAPSIPKTTRLHYQADVQISTVGSNNWAVAGTHSADGRAWLAVDMHMRLGVPGLMYRVSMIGPDEGGGTLASRG